MLPTEDSYNKAIQTDCKSKGERYTVNISQTGKNGYINVR